MIASKTRTYRLVLLDAHAIIHRAYHALPDFSANGEPTGALYGIAAMLIKAINEFEPDYIAACYDLPEPTYRHELFDEYKAGRPSADDALIAQIVRSREIFTAFSIPIYEAPGFEADDVLGTIVEQLKDRDDIEIIIASGDMDTMQLVSGTSVRVYTLKKGIKDTIIYDEKGVKERFGFKPTLLPDYKGLRGDPSDNIPGIPGIGEKSATQLITAFGSLEQIYAKLEKKPEAFEAAGITKRVVTKLTDHKEDAEFSKMLATIRRDTPITYAVPETPWRAHVDPEAVAACFAELEFRSLAARAKTMFETAERETSSEPAVAEETIPETERVETAVALWLLNSTITNPTVDDITQFAQTTSFADAREYIFKQLAEMPRVAAVWEEIEKPLIPVIQKMEKRGVCIDTDYLSKLSKEYHKALIKREKTIYTLAGCEFNINSPRQLGDVLFDTLGLKAKNQKKTGTGQRSTRESELVKLQGEHPIIDEILAYRGLQKLLSTYIDTIPDAVAEDGRLHAEFLQTGTTTGRMSSQHPNLQNIPIRSEEGRAIRNAFVASEGFVLAALDYSQIELRIAAFLSGDEKLSTVFREGGDVHEAVAAEVFAVSRDAVDREMRRKAKVINFGILYGMGVNALQQNLGTNRAEAQTFLNMYFERFTGLADYIEKTKQTAAKHGYTETYYGRRRYIEGINSAVPYIRAGAERMAVNAPIQGTQADIIKIAMVRIDEYLTQQKKQDAAHLLLQVHDELIYEVAAGKSDTLVAEIETIMESVLPLSETNNIPLSVDAKTGRSWGELEDIE